jgi:2-polyprenyl-3-methyl-5-hydroxy-6-metoxy-1,4-benzoquinol methylase
MNCNFCKSNNIFKSYTPIQSTIDLEINICKDCGLVFGEFDKDLHEKSNAPSINPTFSHLSCNANYSDVRVGKQQMVNYVFEALNELNLNIKVNKILDMRSARGHFALKALEYFNIDNIDCIEEDDYMTVKYDSNPLINIWRGKYYNLPYEYKYDLIYSCHTLEHYSDPSKVLNFIKSKLNSDGLFYIDVPNINNIDHNHNIDEFFYDKHLYYFNEETLSQYIESLGFELIYKKSTNQNIGLLFKNSTNKETYPNLNLFEYNLKLINNYNLNIDSNRLKLPGVCENLNNLFSSNQCNAVLGCGRPLDAFIRCGNLDLNNFDYLIDDFLISTTSNLYGKTLYDSNILNSKDVIIDNVLLLVKQPSQKLIETLTKNNPKINIIYFNELMKDA